jgi:nuclear pore complex protein Nup188
VQNFFEKPNKTFGSAPYVTSEFESSEFETKTSAIYVTPNSNGKYDINTIKEDTKWLSKNAKINMMAALRIVAIEFQNRPASHLQGPLSLQDTVNLQDGAGDNQDKSPSRRAAFDDSGASDADTLWNTFQEEPSRRRRLFAAFLSEKQHFFMAASYVYSVKLYRRLPWEVKRQPPVDLHESYNLSEMHAEIPRDPRELVEKIVMGYLEIILGLNAELESGLEGLTDDDVLLESEATSQSWCLMTLKVALYTSEVIFQALDYDEQHSAVLPKMVGQWFEAMAPHCFFDAIPVCSMFCVPFVGNIETFANYSDLSRLSTQHARALN